MNSLAISVVVLTAFVFESISAPLWGFYIIPSWIVLIVFFSLPMVIRSLNALIAGSVGLFFLWAWQGHLVIFVIPYFIFISLLLYGIAKK